jgi:BirA family transcriptional regulator, biotin operon repressor / biotin---[acetyl-CoA-carboxylase] ligase
MPHRHARAAAWEGRPVPEWQRSFGVPRLRIYDAIGSTSTLALRLARRGAPHGTVVMAERQLAGRGRAGRPWLDAPGRSLLLSVVLDVRAAGGQAAPGALPIRCGLVLLRAIDETVGVRAALKWPNDIVADDDRKIAGILCEGSIAADGTGRVVAGFGVNVGHAADDWADAIRGAAASLSELAGRPLARAPLAAALIRGLLALETPAALLRPEEIGAVDSRMAWIGCDVELDGQPAGRVLGVDATGALRVSSDGTERRLLGGTLRPSGRRRPTTRSG